MGTDSRLVLKLTLLLSAATVLAMLGVFGCGGSSPVTGGYVGPRGDFSLSSNTLANPCASLTVSNSSIPSFPAGTTVTFVSANGTSYNGDTSATAGADLYAGFPPNTPPGDYTVMVQQPGGAAVNAGTVALQSSTC